METITAAMIAAMVVIRGIPKEGWKHENSHVKQHYLRYVVIRGIPKEGWKLREVFSAVGGYLLVVIRGIPKEGWKHEPRSSAPRSLTSLVVIRGIPKEGWKPLHLISGPVVPWGW